MSGFFNVNDLEERAKAFEPSCKAVEVYLELARRIRKENDENSREPAVDPLPGDMVRRPGAPDCYYIGSAGFTTSERDFNKMCCSTGAAVVRRREPT